MKIYSEILGNTRDEAWHDRLKASQTEYIDLDQWTAQKSRFVVRSTEGEECAVALKRHTQLLDGDILDYDASRGRLLVVRIRLQEVMVADLTGLLSDDMPTAIRLSVELGHALGNQHWPAVVKDTKVYVPLTVDRKVMESVMRTHHIEQVVCTFQPGEEIIPYLAPHEIRRLFGGASHESHVHGEEHCHCHQHCHA